jgi:hypothetical protein
MSNAAVPPDLTPDAEWLRLAANSAGEVVSDMLAIFGEPGDDEGIYRKLATVSLELRADAMPYLVARADVREAFVQMAWRIIERRLPGIMAKKATVQ